jgi:hypothetical protein
MNKEEILKLARKHLQAEPIYFPAACGDQLEWKGSTEALLKFAKALQDDAYREGHEDGVYEESSYNIDYIPFR